MKALKMDIRERETNAEYSTEIRYDVVERYLQELADVTQTNISQMNQLNEDEKFSGKELDTFLLQLGFYSKMNEMRPVFKAIYEKFPEHEGKSYDVKLKMIETA